MTVATVPDIDALDALDWDPPCTAKTCSSNHPPATHVGHGIGHPCTIMMCADCTRRHLEAGHVVAPWKCGHCGYRQICRLDEIVRIEPLS